MHKGFPKVFQPKTAMAVDGYPHYQRRDNGRTVLAKTHDGYVDLDNRWIVPYNPYLSTKFQAHINLEACTSVKSVKYLFKYVYKGHDCANVEVTMSNTEENAEANTNTDSESSTGSNGKPKVHHDEVTQFLDARYVSAPEAFWRISEFKMHHNSHSIVRLALHLKDQQSVCFTSGHHEEAAEAASRKDTTLTDFFTYNKIFATMSFQNILFLANKVDST